MVLQTRQELESTPLAGSAVCTIQQVSVRSVAIFSAMFSATISLVILVAAGVLYLVGQTTGVLGHIQTALRSSGYPHFRVHTLSVFLAVLVVTVAGAIAWTALNTLGAWVFNLVSEAVGGIKVTIKE